jgi:hypothetical protein
MKLKARGGYTVLLAADKERPSSSYFNALLTGGTKNSRQRYKAGQATVKLQASSCNDFPSRLYTASVTSHTSV